MPCNQTILSVWYIKLNDSFLGSLPVFCEGQISKNNKIAKKSEINPDSFGPASFLSRVLCSIPGTWPLSTKKWKFFTTHTNLGSRLYLLLKNSTQKWNSFFYKTKLLSICSIYHMKIINSKRLYTTKLNPCSVLSNRTGIPCEMDYLFIVLLHYPIPFPASKL